MACLGYRACLGLLNLSKTYGEERLEAACRRALAIGSPTRIRIIAILKAKLDQHPDLFLAADAATATALRIRGNVRGADYFRVPSMSTDTETTDENTGSIWNTRSRSGGTAGHLQRNTQGQKFHEGVEHASFFLDICISEDAAWQLLEHGIKAVRSSNTNFHAALEDAYYDQQSIYPSAEINKQEITHGY